MTTVTGTLRASLADAFANRGSFWFQVAVMVVNDGTWIVFWVLFFHQVGTLRGWGTQDVIVLFSMLMTSAGAALGLLANSRRIGHLAADGELDETLVLPVGPLSHILTSRIDPANMGDLLFGPVLFVVAGDPTPERAALFVLGAVTGSVVLVGFLVACGALTLFVGGRGEQADLGFNAILIFASYPLDLFGGATKVMLFTAVPAAFVTGLPAQLVRSFDPAHAALLVAMAGFFAALGWATFHLGLRHYSSGSIWTR
ncbi:MAG TPA: ABC-2 family transporter protein [Gaiellales bacterium]|nr:ABC-2 family transporter protein [Gaiellales bacterium]